MTKSLSDKSLYKFYERLNGDYDPEMNRYDKRLSVIEKRANQKTITRFIHDHYQEAQELYRLLLSSGELTEREKLIITQRYQESHTLADCGRKHNISLERVRQIQHRALEKLKRTYGVSLMTELIWYNRLDSDIFMRLLSSIARSTNRYSDVLDTSPTLLSIADIHDEETFESKIREVGN